MMDDVCFYFGGGGEFGSWKKHQVTSDIFFWCWRFGRLDLEVQHKFIGFQKVLVKSTLYEDNLYIR